MADFKLSAQLVGHDSDIRDLAFPAPDLVLSASRDHTVRAWRRTSTSPPTYEPTIVNQIHEYVNALTYIPPSKDHPEGLVVSGGKDPCLDVRKPSSVSADAAERLLPGHANNVCSLAAAPNGKYFVSGSWDHTARVWSVDNWDTEVTLVGHEGAVWDVLPLTEIMVATGCADKNIRLYDLRQAVAGQAEPRSVIHTADVVRGLCRLPAGHPSGADIASSHNDGVIRLWKLSGQQVGELRGHDSFVYRLATLPSGEIVSAAEDRTVRIWRGSECIQTITHPAISVWTVAVCHSTGDIVTGTSDGVVRIFTRSPECVASADVLQNFDEAVQSSSIPQQQMGDINKEKLPGPEFLTTKSGTKEGQVQLIREENGSISAHTWSSGAQQWINVGTVVDAAASSGHKAEYNGKKYDYVFDVAIEEGQPSLKLPYNLSDNPYETATKFINDNELSLNYLDQVAKFIVSNTQGATLGQSNSAAPDPFGTESRYRPGEEVEEARIRILPQRDYLDIRAVKLDPVFKKIDSINSALIAAGRKDLSLNPSAKSVLGQLRSALEKGNLSAVPADAFHLLTMMCTRWDYSDRLAPLDLLRCTAAYPQTAQYDPAGIARTAVLDTAQGSKPNENMAMMAFRTMANLFVTKEGRNLMLNPAHLTEITSFFQRFIDSHNRNLQIALTTVAINYAVLASHNASAFPKEAQLSLLGAMATVLTHHTDGEVVFRALVATGTIVGNVGRSSVGREVSTAVLVAKDRGSESRVKDVADECMVLL